MSSRRPDEGWRGLANREFRFWVVALVATLGAVVVHHFVGV
jgi:hypothetical protein